MLLIALKQWVMINYPINERVLRMLLIALKQGFLRSQQCRLARIAHAINSVETEFSIISC